MDVAYYGQDLGLVDCTGQAGLYVHESRSNMRGRPRNKAIRQALRDFIPRRQPPHSLGQPTAQEPADPLLDLEQHPPQPIPDSHPVSHLDLALDPLANQFVEVDDCTAAGGEVDCAVCDEGCEGGQQREVGGQRLGEALAQAQLVQSC